MDSSVALLLTLLQLLDAGSAAPVPADVVKMKAKVKWMAEQLVVKLNKDFQVTCRTLFLVPPTPPTPRSGPTRSLFLLPPPQFPVNLTRSPSADDLGGPSSIGTVLEGYNSLISDTLYGVTQVKTEVSALTGYLDHWSQGHCKGQRTKLQLPEPLQELQSRKEFVLTVSIEALMRVREFLELLLKNLDHLETC